MSTPLFSDGVIVIDKPAGPTSHDIVAVMRRTISRRSAIVDRPSSMAGQDMPRSRRSTMADRRSTMKVGHTGTLDPLASGVLPLVLGKATRLAQFLSSVEKEYEAEIELGAVTTTADRGGEIVPHEPTRRVSDLDASLVEQAVAAFRGTYLQQPPVFSAKKIDGDRAYDLARRNHPVAPDPVTVTASSLEVIDWHGSRLRVRLVCSAGYYVRSLAQALGERLGTGAHLGALVRTRSGEFSLADAIGLDVLDRRPEEAAARVIPLSRLLPALPAITLTPEGASLAARGGFIGPSHFSGSSALGGLAEGGRVRLLHPDGHLVAIAEPGTQGRTGLLHPGVVLE